jgi:hypothetical protein
MGVAAGGNGCTPAIAPSEYWGWKYQSPAGQAAVNAWFQGYPLGAKAAEQDGVGFWQSIQMHLQTPGDATQPATQYGAEPAGANPFYPGGEMLPVPQPEPLLNQPLFDELPSDEPIDNAVEFFEPQSAFHQPSPNDRWNQLSDESEMVPDLEVASRKPTASTELIVPDNRSQEFSDAFVNDLFGTPADSDAGADSDELPFSFE